MQYEGNGDETMNLETRKRTPEYGGGREGISLLRSQCWQEERKSELSVEEEPNKKA
jgi:hypothetical protein